MHMNKIAGKLTMKGIISSNLSENVTVTQFMRFCEISTLNFNQQCILALRPPVLLAV